MTFSHEAGNSMSICLRLLSSEETNKQAVQQQTDRDDFSGTRSRRAIGVFLWNLA